DSAITRNVNPVEPDDERIARRVLWIKYEIVYISIDRTGDIEAKAQACVGGADGDAGSGYSRGRAEHIRQAHEAAHRQRWYLITQRRISTQADHASRNSAVKRVRITGNPHNFADTAAAEETAADGIAAAIDVITDGVDRPHQVGAGAGIFDAIETYPS